MTDEKKPITLTETADAMIWAQEFVRTKLDNGWSLEDIDESLMVGWFASAMQTAVWLQTYALEKRVSEAGWQPIETAPRDNKRPLYLAQFDEEGTLIDIDFDCTWESEIESWEAPNRYYFWASAHGNIEEPTHWAYQDTGMPPRRTSMADELKHIIQLIDDMRDNRVIEAAIRAHVQAAIDAALESAEQAVLDKGRVSIAADLPSSSGYCTSADIIRSRIGTNPLADLQQKNLELDRHNMELRDRVAELEEEITSFRRPTEVNGELVQNVPPHVLADLSRKDAKIAELERERDEVRKDVESHKAML